MGCGESDQLGRGAPGYDQGARQAELVFASLRQTFPSSSPGELWRLAVELSGPSALRSVTSD